MSDQAFYNTLRAANAARQQEWDKEGVLTLAYRGNELAGETGEACNAIKKLERERLGIRGSRDTVEHLAEELADVVICVDLIALAVGVDLDAAVIAKFNATSERYGLRTRLARTSDEIARLRRWIADLQSSGFVNCVYCGYRYGPDADTPLSMADVLKAHVEVCPDHPMSALKVEVERLRAENAELRNAAADAKWSLDV